MKSASVLLLIQWFSLVLSYRYVPYICKSKNYSSRTETELKLGDSIDTIINGNQGISEGVQAFQTSFLNTISFKFMGAIAGNLFAAFLVTSLPTVISKIISKIKETVPEEKPKDKIIISNKELDTDKAALDSSAILKLIICILIDITGDVSFLLPGIGETEDLIWAPLLAFVISKVFGSNYIVMIEFVKEILPGTDILPLATLTWLLENRFGDSQIAKLLKLGDFKK